MIDGSQSVGAMPLDVGELRPDFLITVGYKWLLGPFGVGYLYVADEHREGEPLEQNWILRAGSEDFARLVDYRDEYQPGARRFDVGQRTKFELDADGDRGARAAARAGRSRESRPRSRTRTAEIARARRALGLAPLPDDAARTAHARRAAPGRPCASGSFRRSRRRDCYAAVRGASLRIAPHLHTSGEDVERLLSALAGAVHA